MASACITWLASGPMLTPMGELPPTGRRVRLVGTDFGRIGEDGRAVEHWSGPDIGALMADLGMSPPLEPPPAPNRPARPATRNVPRLNCRACASPWLTAAQAPGGVVFRTTTWNRQVPFS